ncbi:YolD-like family protein [Paenibacillus psychroresistens]|uniref:YolD-like family protein n=1 Tax=Paenibacillus psychroresistens TaxID=1778678 RepID=A0A6B8RI15_9BACL|nr:YolD-like family protein [Paenibacillus psychroresistens]QGQ95890.1 YolD-like family protein [Paenibacillus psychroresistens]
MAKKLEGNGMWESSRMMLPEHREEILKQNKAIKKLIKPVLDEQEVAVINQAIESAIKTNATIILTVFGKYELRNISGIVLKLDLMLQMVKIILEDPYAEQDECEWVPLRNILKAEVKEVEVWDEGDIDW